MFLLEKQGVTGLNQQLILVNANSWQHQFGACMVHNWAQNDQHEDFRIPRNVFSNFGFLGSPPVWGQGW